LGGERKRLQSAHATQTQERIRGKRGTLYLSREPKMAGSNSEVHRTKKQRKKKHAEKKAIAEYNPELEERKGQRSEAKLRSGNAKSNCRPENGSTLDSSSRLKRR